MAGIRGRDTKPELLIRKGLHAKGFRFRLHGRKLPGRPDLVFPARKATIFVHGCFWHGHDCHLFKWPSSREEFWRQKIAGNRERDGKAAQMLLSDGWRVLVLWECALKGRERQSTETVLDQVADWLQSDRQIGEIRGESSVAC